MTPPCYPMRPCFGPRPVAAPGWVHQPKLNGWRALLHVGTGALWSRHGRPLRHAERWAAGVAAIQAAIGTPDIWLDCEAMGIRTTGTSLVVLDVLMAGNHAERREWLRRRIGLAGAVPTGGLVRECQDPEAMIGMGQAVNREAGETIYEGVVSKRADSPYLMQNEVENKETATWLKWRFPEAHP